MGKEKNLADMEMVDISQGILEDRERIIKNISALWKLAEQKASTDVEYRKAFAITIERLRADGKPATLVKELAEGEVAEQRFKMDLTSAQFRASLAALEALQTSMQALQSILKHLEKV